jgi:hypothetical protein
MKNPLSAVELQLVKSSLTTKTDDEIAELLDRPVHEVVEIINTVTDGKADERTRDVLLYKKELENKNRKKISKSAADKKEREYQRSKKLERERERAEAERQWHAQRESFRKRESRSVFKTRKLDLENCISVKLDDKTYALVERQKTEKETQAVIEMTKFNYNMQKRQRLLIKED